MGWSLYTVIAVVAYSRVRAVIFKQGNSTLAPAAYYCECPVGPDRIWNLVFMWNLLVLKCEPYLQVTFNLRSSAYFTFSLTCLKYFLSISTLVFQVDFKLRFKIELINSLFPSSAFNCFLFYSLSYLMVLQYTYLVQMRNLGVIPELSLSLLSGLVTKSH